MNTSAQILRGAPSAAMKDRPSTQVETQIGEINRELERFDKALAEHATRLQSVLRQEAGCDKPDCQTPEEMLVPTADQLRTVVKRMTRQRLALEDMTSRTEA